MVYLFDIGIIGDWKVQAVCKGHWLSLNQIPDTSKFSQAPIELVNQGNAKPVDQLSP